MAGPYELFKTNENLETKGVDLNYGSFYLTIARAGGTNRKYARTYEAKTRPYRRQIATNTLDDATDRRVMAEIYAEAVVLGWRCTVEGEDGKKVEKNGYIPGPDGELMPFTKENVVKLFLDLPDLFADVVTEANKVSVFRDDVMEVDAKN